MESHFRNHHLYITANVSSQYKDKAQDLVQMPLTAEFLPSNYIADGGDYYYIKTPQPEAIKIGAPEDSDRTETASSHS